jgi:beta-phosphoglucomutase-like phosphatase (HAD superfamily)
MTNPTQPAAELDAIIRRARNLLLDFNGPVCELYARQPVSLAADHLRSILAAETIQLPHPVSTTTDPLAVLASAATISRELAERLESHLTQCELTAIPTAQPAGYLHDLIATARESGRTVTVLSTCSVQAVRMYLARNGLDDQVGLVVARQGYDPSPADSSHLIRHALTAINADADACAVVAESPAVIEAAKSMGAATIAYAPHAETHDHLDATHPGVIVASLADIVLTLRARPLPN